MNDFTPVSCYLYDCLEAIATLKHQCSITYRERSDKFTLTKVRGQIVAIYAADGEDWCKLGNGTVICLTQIEEFEL